MKPIRTPLLLLVFTISLTLKGQEPGKLPPPITGVQSPANAGVPEFTLTSPAFLNHRAIPVKYTQGGQRISPPLEWTNTPANTAEFLVLLTDPESGTCAEPERPERLHWMVAKIPGNLTKFAEGAVPPTASEVMPYYAVCLVPPSQPDWRPNHHWHFALFALSAPLKLSANPTHEEVLSAMQGKVLASARLRPLTTRGERRN